MTPEATEAMRRVRADCPYAEVAEYTERSLPGFMVWDGMHFDPTGFIGDGPTEDQAWVNAAAALDQAKY